MADKNVPGLAREAVSDLNRLIKLEVELAGERVKAGIKKKAISAGAGVSGAFFLMVGLLFLLAAGAAGLATVVPWWLALLIVGGGVLLMGAILAGAAATGFRSSSALIPKEAKDQIKEDVRWLRERSS